MSWVRGRDGDGSADQPPASPSETLRMSRCCYTCGADYVCEVNNQRTCAACRTKTHDARSGISAWVPVLRPRAT